MPEKKDNDVKIGVFICHCGSNIAGYLEMEELADYAETLPNVTFVQRNLYTCSEGGINEIKKAIKKENLTRVVVASCTPRTHGPLFMSSCGEAGLNPYLFEMVNIRDQCSWVHMQQKEEGTSKAKDLIRMGVAKAALLQPQEPIMSDVQPRALVIGGGISGMTASLALGNRGYEVVLVEKQKALGGMMNRLNKLGPVMTDAGSMVEEIIGKITLIQRSLYLLIRRQPKFRDLSANLKSILRPTLRQEILISVLSLLLQGVASLSRMVFTVTMDRG